MEKGELELQQPAGTMVTGVVVTTNGPPAFPNHYISGLFPSLAMSCPVSNARSRFLLLGPVPVHQ